MKKIILSLLSLLLVCSLFAQVPQSFKYQTVVRATDGTVIASQAVGFRISILQGSSTGTAVYVETFSTTTNQFGLASLNIGQGTPVSGNFTTIDWSTGLYWVKVEIDPAGGTAYAEAGTSQLLSVPYALHSKTAENAYWFKTGNDISYTAGKVGIGVSAPSYRLDVTDSYQYGTALLKTTHPNTGVHESILSIQNVSNNASSQANIKFDAGNPAHGRAIISATHDVSAGTVNGNLSFLVRNGATSYANALTLRSSGNIGINQPNPAARLDVNGDAQITGHLTVTGNMSLGGTNITFNINNLSGNGMVAPGTVDANSTGFGAALFMASDGNYEEADADAVTTMPCVALALETGTGNKKVLLQGYIRNDSWTWTPGGLIFISPTTGALTQTRPSTTGQQVQIAGYAVKTNTLFFNPNLMLIELK